MLTLQAIARETWSLILPASCAGCDRPGSLLCPECTKTFSGGCVIPELAIRRELVGVDVVACAPYAHQVRRALAAFKDGGLHRLAAPLAQPMAQQLDRLLSPEDIPFVLVPVPSSRQGWRRRGYEPTWLLAKALSHFYPSMRVCRALRRAGKETALTAHYGLGRAARLSRTEEFISVMSLTQCRVVLIDDVITTGATMERAACAVRKAGGSVVAAMACAATVHR